MAIIYIGTSSATLQPMPDPKLDGLTVRLQDLDGENSTRTASGKMVRDRVVGGETAKRKLEIQWPPMGTNDMKTLLQAIAGTFFYVKYPDPYTGGNRVGVFYAGDRSAAVYNTTTERGILWNGLEVNFIER